MRSALSQSTRLVVDLQACQTEVSATRGVGRYSHALATAIAQRAGPIETHVLLSRDLGTPPLGVPVPGNRVHRLPCLPDWHVARDHVGGERDSLDALACAAFVQRIKPDIVHVSHVFEGYADRVAQPAIASRAAGQLFSATLYDLIPLVFPGHYFRSVDFRAWYLARTAWLRNADLLLAISESTRRDAIELLGIDESRIVTIHGGVADDFRPPADRERLRDDVLRKYGLGRRFVLYTGGDDFRKNLQGAIEGFARVPRDKRADVRLAIVCGLPEDERRRFEAVAAAAGLASDDVVFTGYVSDADLRALYGACDVFLFPSLYEGLGLPVLEAMACGAPVIGADNSSIRECIARQDALFDTRSHEAVARAISAVLDDAGFADDLRRHGLSRSRDYSWQRTATTAIDALHDALDRVREGRIAVAVSGWLPRRRMAALSPLPPARTGIADDSAQFFPYLARYFDIDVYIEQRELDCEALTTQMRVFDARDFERNAARYDVVLYEVGNSDFHLHMLRMLPRIRGIVMLHDAYLSGISRYIAVNSGDPLHFQREMLHSHGARARALLAPAAGHRDPESIAVVELPTTKSVLDAAVGVLSHSPFNLRVARRFYPEGWQAPYRTIPQIITRKPQVNAMSRAEARDRLGIASDAFVVATFGHVVWTKCGDRLLDAFLASGLDMVPGAMLVFAGQMADDDFGMRLGNRLDDPTLAGKVRCTGYLGEHEYDDFLLAADLAVQLRIKSRGGTPKGVLDCLARGVPVAVNDDASYTDYPDYAVIKLAPEPAVAEIAALFERVRREPAWAATHAAAGYRYAREFHDGNRCAAAFAAAAHEFDEREKRARSSWWSDRFAPHLAGCEDVDRASEAAAQWLAAMPAARFEKRRIWVDVSHIAAGDHQSGIQRVVRNIVASLTCAAMDGADATAVVLDGGGLRPANDWLALHGLLTPVEAADPVKPVSFAPGDVLLMLDSSWARYAEFAPVFERARRSDTPIVTVVYDLLPIRLPPGNFVVGGREWFEGWLRQAIAASDVLMCISRSTAADLCAYIEEEGLAWQGLAVGYWHLGCDLDRGVAPPSAETAAEAPPYLLMIGTIEPRKQHALALDAMELLWQRGDTTRLVVAGKPGWLVEELMERLASHSEAASRLVVMHAPTDAEVADLYHNALGLLLLSRGEGFGLPLIEAAQHGTPILCSDIPVFREVAGECAAYTAATDAEMLATDIATWIAAIRAGNTPSSRAMRRLTWDASAAQLAEVLLEARWHKQY